MSIWGVSHHHHGGFAAAHGFDPTKSGARPPASFADMMTATSGSGTDASASGSVPDAKNLTNIAGLFGLFQFQAPADAADQPPSAANDPQQSSGTGLNDIFTTVSMTVQEGSPQPAGHLHAMMNAMMTEMHRLMEMAEHLLADVEPHCCCDGGSDTAADAGSAQGTTAAGTTTGGSAAADGSAPAATTDDAAPTGSAASAGDTTGSSSGAEATAAADTGGGSGSSVAQVPGSPTPLDVADVVPAIAPLDPGIDPTTGLPKVAA